jgi:hypothetical protein
MTLLGADAARLGLVGDLALDQRGLHIARADGVAGDVALAISRATVLVRPSTPCLAAT